jgi:hypothetical protein
MQFNTYESIWDHVVKEMMTSFNLMVYLHPTFRSISIQPFDHLTMDFFFLGMWQGPQNGLRGWICLQFAFHIFQFFSIFPSLQVFCCHSCGFSSSHCFIIIFCWFDFFFCYWRSLIEMSMNQNIPYPIHVFFLFGSILWCSQSNDHPKDDLVRFDEK